MKKPKMIMLLGLAALAAAAGFASYYYYTTTPGYALGKAKKACAANDIRLMADNSVAFLNNQTRELSAAEKEQMLSSISQAGTCPYKDAFSKKATMTPLDEADLKKYGVDEGFLVSFAGEDKSKSVKLLKFNGKWRFLLIEMTYQAQEPAAQQAPPVQPQYQVEVGGPSAAPGPAQAVPVH